MALRLYDGINPATGSPYQYNAGNFYFDDTEFSVQQDGHLYYVGGYTNGEMIIIPKGIKDCTGMFEGYTQLITPPRIPEGVETIDRMFKGCQNLQKYPRIPSSVKSKTDYLSDISKNDLEYNDITLELISREIDMDLNGINAMYQKKLIEIEDAYIEKLVEIEDAYIDNIANGIPSEAQKKMINADLMAQISICEIQIDALTKMQNHLEYSAQNAKENFGAPRDYLKDSIEFYGDQINKVQTELNDIKAELRYRNPTVLDIAKTAAVDAKERLISYGQKATNELIDKASRAANSLEKKIGNVFRAAELSCRKMDIKIMEKIQDISADDIERTSHLYDRIAPNIYKIATKTNSITEAMKTLSENLKGHTYISYPGVSKTGEKLVSRMMFTLQNKVANFNDNVNRLERMREKAKELEQNLSPKEHETSKEYAQSVSRNMGKIQGNMRSAQQEIAASYTRIKESVERSGMTGFEKEMNPSEISDRYPNAIRSAKDMFPDNSQPITYNEGKLYNEIIQQQQLIDPEMNKKMEEVFNNIRNSSEQKIQNTIEKVDERGVSVKEDHAEPLSSSFFGGEAMDFSSVSTDHKDGIMDTYSGQQAIINSKDHTYGVDYNIGTDTTPQRE